MRQSRLVDAVKHIEQIKDFFGKRARGPEIFFYPSDKIFVEGPLSYELFIRLMRP